MPLFTARGSVRPFWPSPGPDEFASVIQKGLKAYTENTITDYRLLEEDMVLIRQRGYAVDNMEHEFGLKCVAVPIFNSEGDVVAGLSISGPSLRMSDEKIEDYSVQLKDVARRAAPMLI